MSFPLELKQYTLQGHTLELFVPQLVAVSEAYRGGNIAFPYWSQVWPAARALTEFLLQQLHYVSGKKVVEIAGGLGMPSVAAAPYAASVLCTDYDPEAVAAVQASARHNGLTNLTAERLDWRSIPRDLEADVVLLSDINYDPASFDVQGEMIERFLRLGTTILLSTPQRLMAKDFIAQLLPWCILQQEMPVMHGDKEVFTTVMVLKVSGER